MIFEKRSLFWLRAGCGVFSAIALSFVIHRIDGRALWTAFRSMRGGWFFMAFLLYGFLFFPAAWRWHLTLRLAQSSVSRGVIVRFSFIGHFFYTILLGAAGGDFAKSALYARWYNFSLPQILAAASLDRLLGFGGLILFGALAFGLAATNGGLDLINSISWKWPGGWLLGAIALIALLIFVFKRFGKETAGGRFAQAFSDNCRRLVVAPKLLFPGLIYSFLVQVALSGTLALSLCAVSHEPVPWLRLIWTLPIISIISALPITIAGMGVRDGAALALWGLCGINGATAVAATVLTASISLLWALVGGIVLWHETRRRHVLREIETAAVLERVEI